jgi:hypothetical protein
MHLDVLYVSSSIIFINHPVSIVKVTLDLSASVAFPKSSTILGPFPVLLIAQVTSFDESESKFCSSRVVICFANSFGDLLQRTAAK